MYTMHKSHSINSISMLGYVIVHYFLCVMYNESVSLTIKKIDETLFVILLRFLLFDTSNCLYFWNA